MSAIYPDQDTLDKLYRYQRQAQEAVEGIVRMVDGLVDAIESARYPYPIPTEADVGRLFMVADATRLRGEEAIEEANKILAALPVLGEARENAEIRARAGLAA
jgi:hypothetical protein